MFSRQKIIHTLQLAAIVLRCQCTSRRNTEHTSVLSTNIILIMVLEITVLGHDTVRSSRKLLTIDLTGCHTVEDSRLNKF